MFLMTTSQSRRFLHSILGEWLLHIYVNIVVAISTQFIMDEKNFSVS